MRFESIEEIVERLCESDLYDSTINYQVIDEIATAIINIGNRDEVYKCDDSHLGLKGRLSSNFLQSSIDEINKSQFESEIEALIEQANTTIALIHG